MLERDYQSKLKNKLETMFPDAIIVKTDPNSIQGIPDLLILYGDTWAALETKRSSRSKRRPNQPYYVKLLNSMSFCSFINPENEEIVLNELQSALYKRR